jgi:Asp-tRNA(Asn)/Glu-tRNA(Gln) amidotransferase C subunit
MAKPANVDVETLARMARELLGQEYPREWLERFAVQLEGLLEETSKLEEWDLTGIEPARVFRNGE